MELIAETIRADLLRNSRVMREFAKEGAAEPDFIPVVKLFPPDGAATWQLAWIDPDGPYIAFGLCDLSFGSPELGTVRISEIEAARGALGLPAERDRYFRAFKTLSAYADEARTAGRIAA